MTAVAAPAVWPTDVPVHPAAELFPLMTGKDFAELVRDVRENGLLEPIVRTPDGSILDGRNRHRACLEAGIEPTFRTFDGEPWRFVISTNLHRRHLTDGQRAMIAAKIAERHRGAYSRAANSSDEEFASLPPSRIEAARMLSVSPAQVDRARVVEKRGSDALKAAVEAGAVQVSTAARVASELPPVDQDRYVERVKAGGNPRKLAPPDPTSHQAPVTESKRVLTKTFYKADRTVLGKVAVQNVVQMATALTTGLAETSAVDPAITSEEAARWVGDLSNGIRSLRRLHNILKERTS